MLRAVEGHVLQEVGQAVLGILFLQGPHMVGDEKLRAAFGVLVVGEIISESVVQPSGAEGRVGGNGLRLCKKGRQHGGQQEKESFHGIRIGTPG